MCVCVRVRACVCVHAYLCVYICTYSTLNIYCYEHSGTLCNYYIRLFNKEALLLALLDKSSLPEKAKHIRSLKVQHLLCVFVHEWCV